MNAPCQMRWHGNNDSLGAIIDDVQVTSTTVATDNSPDTLDGGAGNNTLSYANSNANVGVNINLLQSTKNGGDAEDDTLVFSSFRHVTGTDKNDVLTGDKNDNQLEGKAGDDSLVGNAGNDTLKGGQGADTLIGGEGADVIEGGLGINYVSYADSKEAVQIDLSVTDQNGGDAQGDKLIDIQQVLGSSNSDRIKGDAKQNTLAGGNGDDTLSGEAGKDILDGGDGVDRFVIGQIYGSAPAGSSVTETVESTQVTRGYVTNGDIPGALDKLAYTFGGQGVHVCGQGFAGFIRCRGIADIAHGDIAQIQPA